MIQKYLRCGQSLVLVAASLLFSSDAPAQTNVTVTTLSTGFTYYTSLSQITKTLPGLVVAGAPIPVPPPPKLVQDPNAPSPPNPTPDPVNNLIGFLNAPGCSGYSVQAGGVRYCMSLQTPTLTLPGITVPVSLPIEPIQISGNRIACGFGLQAYTMPGALSQIPEFQKLAGLNLGGSVLGSGSGTTWVPLVVCSQ